MTSRRRFHVFLACAAFAICCGPTEGIYAAESDPGIWTVFSTTDTISDGNTASRWHYWFDAQARYSDLGSGASQWLVRPAIGYEYRDGARAWVGYARFRSRSRSGRITNENRYWQQMDWRAGQWQGGQLTMRIRLEQRSVDVGDDLGVVLRFMTKYVRPFAGDSSRSLVVGLEPFVALRDTDWGGDAGTGQNRTYIGMSWRVSDKFTLESGYMNQYVWTDGGADRINHLAVLNFKVKL